MFWRWRTRHQKPQPRISVDTIELIRHMARENRLWGAERIRGELLKLGIRVAKRTVQRYLKRGVQSLTMHSVPRAPTQSASLPDSSHARL